MFDQLWAAFTVAAAAAQTARNALQRQLTERLGTVGATHVRFLYGAPFALLFFALVVAFLGRLPPAPPASYWGWVALGGTMQIVATALLLAGMRERSFLVVVAYSKTEPIQVALFAVAILGERLTPLMALAALVGTAGVLIASWPPKAKAGETAWSAGPAIMGCAAGGLFALSAVGFRGAIVALGADDFFLGATTTLLASLAFQALILSLYLLATDRETLRAVGGAWRVSLAPGFAGAFASQMWFAAFALEQVARVRTLGLVEVLFAWAISKRVLKQPTSAREAAGVVLVVMGVALMLNA
jgi:drug/metabolite transporter (DMT)-like permease